MTNTTPPTIGDQNSPTPFPDHLAVQNHLTTTEKDPNEVVVEAVRRSRGRPPGSKNKQKPPVQVSAVSREPDEPCMSPCVLEVCGGSDIIAAVRRFCSHRKTGICILSGSGAVSDVSFTGAAAARFRGSFNLLSISATILPHSSPIISINNGTNFVGNKFVVTIGGGEGKTFSGGVVEPLIASGTVYMVAVTFSNPLYHRLPPPPPPPMMMMDVADQMIIRNSTGYRSAAAAAAAIDGHQSPAAAGSSGGQLPRDNKMIWPLQALPHNSSRY